MLNLIANLMTWDAVAFGVFMVLIIIVGVNTK